MSVSGADAEQARLWLARILAAPPSLFLELTLAVLVILKKTAEYIDREMN